MKIVRLLSCFLLFPFSFFGQVQMPDFSVTDINGTEHSLYADYLDQGKLVVINITATWSPWNWEFHQTGVLEAFYQAHAGAAVVMDLEMDLSTGLDEIMGIGPGTQGDWTSGVSYPIVNVESQDLFDIFEIQFYPAVVIICPDGRAFSSYSGTYIEEIQDMHWVDFPTSEILFNKSIELCDWNAYGQFIDGEVYVDENGNCVDDQEPKLPGVYMEISNGNFTYHRYTNEDGYFKAPAQEQVPYTVTVQPPSFIWQACNGTENVFFDGSQDTISLSFGLKPLQECAVAEVDITSPVLVRCFPSQLFVRACNKGTVPLENGQVSVTLDPFFLPLSFSIPPSSNNGNTYFFNNMNLDVMECVDIEISVEVSCDADLGQEHCYSADLTGTNVCGIEMADQECQENVGSYDPNDKRSFPAGEGEYHYLAANTDIEYVIRFQNTGTYTAFNVMIADTISPLLDLSTLRPGASSHPYEMQITETRTLKFSFPNIMLPDSTSDLEGSQGFISFKISQMPDLADGKVIENEAGIFFDFNEPVITNKTFLTIGELSSIEHETGKNELPIAVFPNPVSDILQVRATGSTGGTWQLYHVSGVRVQEQAYRLPAFEIATGTLSPGIYWLKLEDRAGGRGVQKVIVQ